MASAFEKYQKVLRLTIGNEVITNDRILSESFELEESVCSDTDLRYGCCESTCMRISIVGNTSYEGKLVNVEIGLVGYSGVLADESGNYIVDNEDSGIALYNKNNITYYQIGKYKVVSDKPSNDRVYRNLECYDVMYEIINKDIADWYKNLTFPMTLKAFRDSLFIYLGVEQVSATLINDTYVMVGGYIAYELSCKDILENLCEVNGVFGHINREGKFEYLSLDNRSSLTLEWYVDGSGQYEDYVTSPITEIASYTADGNIGQTVGVAGNRYTLNNNLIMYGDEGNQTQIDALTRLLNKIGSFTYRPYTVLAPGNPLVEIGTGLVINTSYQTINSFIMSRELRGIQSLTDNYSAQGSREQPPDVNRTSTRIKRTEGKTAELQFEVDGIKSTIGEWNEQGSIASTISQIASEIVLKVEASTGKIVKVSLKADPSTGTEFKVGADNISFIANGKMELTANNLEINSTNFKVDASGNITATGGTIGGFTIGASSIYNGMTSLDDTTNNGIYVGTDGIALGKGAFKVTSSGALTSTKGTIGGYTISSDNLSNDYVKLRTQSITVEGSGTKTLSYTSYDCFNIYSTTSSLHYVECGYDSGITGGEGHIYLNSGSPTNYKPVWIAPKYGVYSQALKLSSDNGVYCVDLAGTTYQTVFVGDIRKGSGNWSGTSTNSLNTVLGKLAKETIQYTTGNVYIRINNNTSPATAISGTVHIYKWGGIVMIKLTNVIIPTITARSDITKSSKITDFMLTDDTYRPDTETGSFNDTFLVETNGAIRIQPSQSGKTIYDSAIFITKSW